MPFPVIAVIWIFASWFIQGSAFSTIEERKAFVFVVLAAGAMIGCVNAMIYEDYLEKLQEKEAKQRALLRDAEKLINEYQ